MIEGILMHRNVDAGAVIGLVVAGLSGAIMGGLFVWLLM